MRFRIPRGRLGVVRGRAGSGLWVAAPALWVVARERSGLLMQLPAALRVAARALGVVVGAARCASGCGTSARTASRPARCRPAIRKRVCTVGPCRCSEGMATQHMPFISDPCAVACRWWRSIPSACPTGSRLTCGTPARACIGTIATMPTYRAVARAHVGPSIATGAPRHDASPPAPAWPRSSLGSSSTSQARTPPPRPDITSRSPRTGRSFTFRSR